ncbi:Adenylate kinase protein [Thalictrum thalictroides]|uniref:adenylate kinase n=1 Tax=Thalictrum thalictroides TaxID=46969 RepID=A0A7J6V213_THATH|nr:Adenylate kinase protein [Thalictrum thalictroides]
MASLSINFPILPTNPLPSSSNPNRLLPSSFSHLNSSPLISSSSHVSRSSLSLSRLSSRNSFVIELQTNKKKMKMNKASNHSIVATVNTKPELLKIMISGAPASGKGTQCELITKKYGLVHIAAGDLLRAEVAAGTENGKRAKEYMEKGELVPNEIVVMMVKDRLLQPDSHENGWLLDGYPRSSSQAKALEDLGIHPDLFILLDVPEEILVDRVVGRRLDPVTGRIYHLKYSPPETEEIASRLTQRFDDTEEKVKLRLQTHNQNVEDVLSIYKDVTVKINGSAPKEDVFVQIDNALAGLREQKKATFASVEVGI